MTSRAFMIGSSANNVGQHSNDAPKNLFRRDLRRAINDRRGARLFRCARLFCSAPLLLDARLLRRVPLIAPLAGALLLVVTGAVAIDTAAAADMASANGATVAAVTAITSARTLTLRMGRMTLAHCEGAPGELGAYCGRLARPLDPAGRIAGTLSIYFEVYPHLGPGKARGLLVATEGGPGYPATQSRDEYLALFQPLRQTRDVLIMDNRGTGRSGALDCPELQAAEKWTTQMVGACGASLGNRAALYGTALAADDLAAILERLGAGKIDLYGDSYGTYFEQMFALRHPQALRSVVLDGAYPLRGPDYAWYPTYAPAMRAKFDIACRRAPGCARIPGSSIDHIRPLLERLRHEPGPATAVDADGKERRFTADATHLATVMFGSNPALATVRELDAAARAYLAADRLPLLRLMAETIGSVDSEDARNAARDITQWSAGLEVAVMCHDPPQIFDMRLPPELRAADRDRVIAARRQAFPDTYAPFTLDEYRAMPLDYSFIDQCVAWPVAPAAHPAGQTPNAAYPDVPALVISGELDNMTTPQDGAATAAAFKRGRQILVANSFHVNALPHARSSCAAQLVQHFFQTLDPSDTLCAAEVPPVRLVPRFATLAADVDPAEADAGHPASARALRLAAAAAETVGDIVVRAASNSSGHGVGLRGGTFRITPDGASHRIDLEAVRWTGDLAVSGTIESMSDADHSIHAQVSIDAPEGTVGHLDIRWKDRVFGARAELVGEVGNEAVTAHMPAP